jgi:hypothetical protein
VLVELMLAEFFVTFMLPRRVRREAGLARELDWLLWRCRGATAASQEFVRIV